MQLARREKLTLNLIIWILCGTMLFYIMGLTRILCPPKKILSQWEIESRNTTEKPYVSIYGYYYKINGIVQVNLILELTVLVTC
jgi:chitin synthase